MASERWFGMKQYKFKCPICGKWHDIFYSLGDYVAECDGEQTAYAHFQAKKLEMLLKLLRKLNIEVAEVCDRLRWKVLKVIYGSYSVWLGYGIDGKKHYYTVIKYKGKPNYIASRLRCRRSIRRACKTLVEAKAACQADFNKRRAKCANLKEI